MQTLPADVWGVGDSSVVWSCRGMQTLPADVWGVGDSSLVWSLTENAPACLFNSNSTLIPQRPTTRWHTTTSIKRSSTSRRAPCLTASSVHTASVAFIRPHLWPVSPTYSAQRSHTRRSTSLSTPFCAPPASAQPTLGGVRSRTPRSPFRRSAAQSHGRSLRVTCDSHCRSQSRARDRQCRSRLWVVPSTQLKTDREIVCQV
eukprot:366181-Chlamydomonas_euryale.AAC.4